MMLEGGWTILSIELRDESGRLRQGSRSRACISRSSSSPDAAMGRFFCLPFQQVAHPQTATCDRIFSMSPGKFYTKQKALTYRQFFARRWSAFIRENFDSPEHAAVCFGVDASTSRKWWDGNHSPSGFAVGLAYERFPQQAASALRGKP